MGGRIQLFEIAWDEDDVNNVVESVCRGSYWAKGPFVSQFENEIEAYLGVDHAFTVNSGTTALVTALEACGIGPGDEVIVPPFTFIATANAVELVGATPVFADIDRDSYGLDPEAVVDQITTDTAAILPVHVYGAPCEIDALVDIADDHGLRLVEDAAGALGAESGGRKVTTFGDAGVVSFCQNKIVATGEGGVVVTDDKEVADKVRRYRSHGRASEGYFESSGGGQYTSLGSNYRMADVIASIGCAQMGKVERLIERRRAAAESLTSGLADVPVEPHIGFDDDRHVFQLYTITFEAGTNRATVIDALEEREISSKVYWDPVHLSDYYVDRYGYRAGAFPVAEEVAGRVLSLPMYPDLGGEAIDRIVDAVRVGVEEHAS